MTAHLVKLQPAPDLVDQVYRALLDAISSGSLAPGDRLTQEDIAERLAVSRQPVLQALRLLKRDGLVQDAPGRGLLVTPLDPAWIAQIYEVRGALDALAARLAAGPPRVVLDLGSVHFIDSTGLGIVLGALRRVRVAGGVLRVVVVEPQLTDLFTLLELDTIFELHASVDAATSAALVGDSASAADRDPRHG